MFVSTLDARSPESIRMPGDRSPESSDSSPIGRPNGATFASPPPNRKEAFIGVQDQVAYEFALRDAAARFEETRRLAAELSGLQQTLAHTRAAYEGERAQAAKREAALASQLAEAQRDARDGNSREAVELGARAQVADWRAGQAHRMAEGAQAEQRRASDALHVMEAEVAMLRSELAQANKARDDAEAYAGVFKTRESDLLQEIEDEREKQVSEGKRVSGAASQAIGEATSEAANARREHTAMRSQLERAKEARVSAETTAQTLKEELAAAEQRASQAESMLAEEREKLSSDGQEMSKQMKLAMEQATTREGAAGAALAQQTASAARQLKAIRAELDAERESHGSSMANAVAEARSSAIEQLTDAIALRVMSSLMRRAVRAALAKWAKRIKARRAAGLMDVRRRRLAVVAVTSRGTRRSFRIWHVVATAHRLARKASKRFWAREKRRGFDMWAGLWTACMHLMYGSLCSHRRQQQRALYLLLRQARDRRRTARASVRARGSQTPTPPLPPHLLPKAHPRVIRFDSHRMWFTRASCAAP